MGKNGRRVVRYRSSVLGRIIQTKVKRDSNKNDLSEGSSHIFHLIRNQGEFKIQ